MAIASGWLTRRPEVADVGASVVDEHIRDPRIQPVGDPPPPEVLEPVMRGLNAVKEDVKAALHLMEALDLDGYHVYHAVRAALLCRADRTAEAADAYDQAAARTGNAAEQAYLRRARDSLRSRE